ncbi:MAG: hypothetical protein ACKV22_14300 [Bryobacteraceae bacterium]
MPIGRRAFLAQAACAAAAPSPDTVSLESNLCRLTLDASGSPASLKRGQTDLVHPHPSGSHLRISLPARPSDLVCNRPRHVRRKGSLVTVEYAFPALDVERTYELLALDRDSAALKQVITLRPRSPLREKVVVHLPGMFQLPSDGRSVFVPLQNGIGRIEAAGASAYAFRLAGGRGDEAPLAVPMISEFSGDERLTWCADPLFTTAFHLSPGDRPGEIVWEYPEKVGVVAPERREIFTVIHRGDPRRAFDAFYRTALAEIPEGPGWVHDIAMVGYDYLSRNGRGWFADIDFLESRVARADRPKILLALHGWYDYVGRYAYNPRTQTLDKEWTAFPNAKGRHVLARAEQPDRGNPFHWSKESILSLQPVKMSLADLHRRIGYARSRGFRVALYYADGLVACDGLKDVFDPSKVLRWGGWEGPETVGRSHVQNPLHPEVRTFYKGYLEALLAEFGKEVDALVWDETFHAQPGDLGSDPYPGYADRAMMDLVGDLTKMTTAAGRDLAFLASDDVGIGRGPYLAPYGLAAHGTYQDSGCNPLAWRFGLLPNFRNAIWSCSWAPTKAFNRSRYGVEVFDTAVPISNGYGEDRGVSELPAERLAPLMELFERRKRRRMEIGWIEEKGGRLLYQGRDIQSGYPA